MILFVNGLSFIAGISAGFIVAGGIGALFTTIGVVVRLAYISHTSHQIRYYENCVILGTILGTLLYLYEPHIDILAQIKVLSAGLTFIIGGFMGMFVGCLAMALSETLDVSTVFFRRIHVKKYVSVVIIAIAIGKLIGCFIYW